MAPAFIIELDGDDHGVCRMYLRDHEDGAISWTHNPNKARRFECDAAAETYARARLEGDTIKITEFAFTRWA